MKNNYYEDDYEEEDTYSLGDATVRRPEIQQETLGGLDWVVAALLALFTGGLLALWAFPGLSPHAWEDMAIGAGIRPIKAIFPGFWNAIARGIFSITGISTGIFVMKILGNAFAGLSVGIVYLLLRQVLSITIRIRLQFARRRFLVVRGVAFLGALFFACSDPVWRVGQAFTPSLLLLFMTVLVLALFFGFLMSGKMGQIYLSMFLLGLLTSETPMGFFLLVLVWGVYMLALRHDAIASDSPLLNPIVEQSSKWHLTFLYAFGMVVGIAINCYAFISFDGLDVFATTGSDMPLMYATRWWTQFTRAASPLGWVLGLGICLLPFVVGTVILPRAVDEEQFLPYHIGAVYFVIGSLSFVQLAELSPLWFWTWTRSATINSPYFLLVLVLFSAATVVFALAVMAVDICCRDHRRLAFERFAELNAQMTGTVKPDAASEDVKPLGMGPRLILAIVPLLLIAGALPGRYQGQTRRMLSIVNDYAHEVLKECGDVRCIFSEGAFDSWLELYSAAEGRSLRAHAMISDNSPRQQYIRTHGVTNNEERISLSISVPMALRTIVRDHPDRLNEIAIQLGFEMWKRDGKEIPSCSGVLSRPAGMSEADRLSGVERANELADRILDIYIDGGPSKSAGALANELFRFVQWRIARIARMRAERADRAGDTNQALKDVNISERLDHHNSSLTQIMHDMQKVREQTLQSVTPRQSLQMALARADFTQARFFAEHILKDDPEDPDANFGLGMSYYTQKQWARAEEFLRKCLIKKPKEPAVWNNLGMICMYTERYDDALKHAQRALKLIPDSAEVKDTIKQIEEAREKAKEGGKTQGGETTKQETRLKGKSGTMQQTASTNAPAATKTSTIQVKATDRPKAAEKQKNVTAEKDQAKNGSEKLREEMLQAIKRGDYGEATKHANYILAIDEGNPDANFAVGMAHFDKRQWKKAETSFKKSLVKKPNDPDALVKLAITCMHQSHFDEALAYAEKALNFLPDSNEVKDTIKQIEERQGAKESSSQSSAGKPAAKKDSNKKNPKVKQPNTKPAKTKPSVKKPVRDEEIDTNGLEATVPKK